MSKFQDLLIQRRSIRKYTEDLLQPEETEMILKAALLSPTSKNSHSWQFVVVEDKEMLQKLANCKPHGSNFVANCALAIVVLGNPLVSDVWIEDASIASFAMQLQAEDIGVGSCWVQVRERQFDENITAADYVRNALEIPMPYEVLSIIAFGKKEKERKPNDVEALLWENVHIGEFKS
ncbi:MAG TPA: nitroreductase family protein [Dysgonamonadaceae bacterium]|nr:nitroreductase family protein [Dysgonamonadaceae bacterium]